MLVNRTQTIIASVATNQTSVSAARKSADPIANSTMPTTSPLADCASAASRPPSPALEAGEEDESHKVASAKLVEEPEEGGPKEGRRRTSSVWKGLNLKRRMSKVNTKISSTLTDVGRRNSIFYYGPTEGTPLSPVELSPVSDETHQQAIADIDLAAIESSIVQSLSDLEANSDRTKSPAADPSETMADDHTADSSDQESGADPAPTPPPRGVRSQGAIPKQRGAGRTMSQTHDTEAHEQVATAKSLGARLEGASASRPTELTLFDNEPVAGGSAAQPIDGERAKRNRMQSVPNIKFGRQDTTKLKSSLGKDSSLAHMFRRFSKYIDPNRVHAGAIDLSGHCAFYSFYFTLSVPQINVPGLWFLFCDCNRCVARKSGVSACICVCVCVVPMWQKCLPSSHMCIGAKSYIANHSFMYDPLAFAINPLRLTSTHCFHHNLH